MKRTLTAFALLFLFGPACGGQSGSQADGATQVTANECDGPDDCATNLVCFNTRCVTLSCSDNELSPGEADVDCGGECPACTEGQRCRAASDCASSYCDGEVCRDCQNNDDCSTIPGTSCVRGACIGTAPLGEGCMVDSQCDSGFCVNSVCCNDRCNGTCESCVGDETGAASGLCSAILPDTDPGDHCTETTPDTCGQTGVCNGAGGCAYYESDTVCALASCSGGIRSTARFCDGLGTCSPGAEIICEFGCAGSRCAIDPCIEPFFAPTSQSLLPPPCPDQPL